METKFDPRAKINQGDLGTAPDGKQPNQEATNIDFNKVAPKKYDSETALKDNKEKKIIYDGFLGSGSTLIAAEKLQRKCYGMELDAKYCDVIIERWEQFTGNKAEKING